MERVSDWPSTADARDPPADDIRPPSTEVGVVGWLRHNLFSSLPQRASPPSSCWRPARWSRWLSRLGRLRRALGRHHRQPAAVPDRPLPAGRGLAGLAAPVVLSLVSGALGRARGAAGRSACMAIMAHGRPVAPRRARRSSPGWASWPSLAARRRRGLLVLVRHAGRATAPLPGRWLRAGLAARPRCSAVLLLAGLGGTPCCPRSPPTSGAACC